MRTKLVAEAMARAILAASTIDYLLGRVDELDRLWREGALSNKTTYAEAQRLTFGEPVRPVS